MVPKLTPEKQHFCAYFRRCVRNFYIIKSKMQEKMQKNVLLSADLHDIRSDLTRCFDCPFADFRFNRTPVFNEQQRPQTYSDLYHTDCQHTVPPTAQRRTKPHCKTHKHINHIVGHTVN